MIRSGNSSVIWQWLWWKIDMTKNMIKDLYVHQDYNRPNCHHNYHLQFISSSNLSQSMTTFDMRRVPSPEPVPPPREWASWKPWNTIISYYERMFNWSCGWWWWSGWRSNHQYHSYIERFKIILKQSGSRSQPLSTTNMTMTITKT